MGMLFFFSCNKTCCFVCLCSVKELTVSLMSEVLAAYVIYVKTTGSGKVWVKSAVCIDNCSVSVGLAL